jgi:hypothetical protein
VSGSVLDDSVSTRVLLINEGRSLNLKQLHVQYWVKLDPYEPLECLCDAAICTAATLGSWRSGRREANTCLEYSFPGFSLATGKSIELSFHCSYVDRSPIDETTHYSYPFGALAGDDLDTVTVVYEGQVIWGIEPQ